MSEKKKTEVQKAMEKECILLLITSVILTVMTRTEPISTKCRGPVCAQYNVFTNKCGLM